MFSKVELISSKILTFKIPNNIYKKRYFIKINIKNRFFSKIIKFSHLYAKQTLYSLFSRPDESNDTRINFEKKISIFGIRGDPYAQKR